MLHKKLKLSTVLLLVIGLTGLQAQQVVTSSGGNASGSGGSASYSVGQIVYTTNTAEGSVAQGVQQPYEISVVTGIEEALDISLEIMVYPNPTTDFIRLKIEIYDVENLRYRLYDINASLLQDNKIEGQETNIVMSYYSSGTYFLKVIDNQKAIKTFKIIKH